jgi:voltage-gated sodium channel
MSDRSTPTPNLARPGLFGSTEVELPAYRVQWLARLMYGNAFEFVVFAVIIANAAALAALTFEGLDPRAAAVASAIDQFAIYFYAVELVLRIISYGRKPWMFFLNPWNVFDFLVVGLIPFLDGGTLIFRLVRLLRILRIFRFLPEARILMLSMVKSVAPLANLFGADLPERWGNVGLAMLTLTVMLTLENFPDSFLGGLEVTPLALVYFLSYMFFIVFTVLNVLIGIVLNAMDQARDEVARSADEAGVSSGQDEEIEALRRRIAELEVGARVSPDHLRRIREELDRLAPGSTP